MTFLPFLFLVACTSSSTEYPQRGPDGLCFENSFAYDDADPDCPCTDSAHALGDRNQKAHCRPDQDLTLELIDMDNPDVENRTMAGSSHPIVALVLCSCKGE